MPEGRIGYAPGVYDLFHIGHLNMLRQAREHCDHLVAGVLTDERTELNKGMRPVVPFEERIAIVSCIDYVDQAEPEYEAHKLEVWERIRFDVIIKGDDWKGTDRGDKLEADFAEVGVDVAYVNYTKTTSSSMLRLVLQRAIDGVV